MEKPKQEHIYKLTRARTQLVLRQPFISQFVMGMPLKYDPNLHLRPGGCKTMATDGKFIYWHPECVERWNNEELKFALAHEGFHPGFLHHLREGDRDHEMWNQAGDFAINPILKAAGLTPPKGVLLNPNWDDHSAEWIYDQLKKNAKKKPGKGQGNGQGQGQGQPGQPGDQPGMGDEWNIGGFIKPTGENGKEMTTNEVRVEEQRWIQEFIQAANVAKAIGKLPAGIERMLGEMTDPKINWKSILHRFLTATVRNDYNWSRPNRRYVAQGLYMPHLQSPAIGKGVIMVDTSGSVGERELNQLASEIKAITDAYKVDLTVIYVDSEVAGVDLIDSWNPVVNLKPKGGGGTSFAPGFEHVEAEGIEANFGLYLTDGYSNDFPEQAPNYPFIWVLTETYRGFDPPFGEVLEMPMERSEYDS